MKLYAIKDEIVGFTGAIVHARNDQEITRQFALMVNDEGENMMSKWYKDYSVWRVGDLDRVTGEITETVPKLVVRGDSVKVLKRDPEVIEHDV